MDHQRLAYYNLVLGIRFLAAAAARVTFLLNVSACIGTLAQSKCAIKLRYLDEEQGKENPMDRSVLVVRDCSWDLNLTKLCA